MTLSWRPQRTAPASVFYRVLRAKFGGPGLCAGRLNNSADSCRFYGEPIAATRDRTFVDHPGPGTWTYRIGVSANWLDHADLGDVTVLSTAVAVKLP